MQLHWVVFCVSSALTIQAQDIEEEGIRCYDCNSFNPHCRDQVNQSSPTEGFAVYTHCPKTQRCFIRKDKDGVIVRGCADGWRFSLVDIEYLGCKEQSADWLGPQVWCFCDDDLCNQVPMAQLNRAEYLQLSDSSEYLSVNTDLEVEHELTGWKGMELLEKELAQEGNGTTTEATTTTTTTTTTTEATTTTTTARDTAATQKMTTTTTPRGSTATVPETSASQSTFTGKTPLTNSTSGVTGRPQTSTVAATTSRDTTQSASKADANGTTTSGVTHVTSPVLNSTTLQATASSPSHANSSSKSGTNVTTQPTQSSTSKKRKTVPVHVSTTVSTISTIRPSTEKKADVPWWLWHVVSSTRKPTRKTTSTATTSSSTSTAAKPSTRASRRPGRRRSYLKPKVSLVTRPHKVKGPAGTGKDEVVSTTPASERWTWSPSWWDKWWRPGARRSRRPKRPTATYPRRPRPTQGRGHYWWLAPVGPTRPSSQSMRSPTRPRFPTTARRYSATPRNVSTTSKKSAPTTTTTTTRKATSVTKKPTFAATKKRPLTKRTSRPSYPRHIVATSTPLPKRVYPEFPSWGRRLTGRKKSIYPVMTTKRPRSSTRPVSKRRILKLTSYSTRHATSTSRKTTTKAPSTSARVTTTRRRRPTTLARRRKYPRERPIPETQQKDSEEFFCWDCYSASTNCRDVVNSPYSYYVGRTPCPYTRKCFVRKDAGVIYRGCADGWTSSLIDRDYNGCKVQYTWGRPVEWCFCDTHLCNGQSLKHIKAMYDTPSSAKDNEVVLNLPIGKVVEGKTPYGSEVSNHLR